MARLVRMKLARNPIVDPKILVYLADDDHHAVRFNVSANKNTPTEILQEARQLMKIMKLAISQKKP